MRQAHCQVATLGMFAWARLEPEEGRYEFGWLDRVIEILSEQGRWFILGTPSAAPPAWMAGRYPETLRVGSDRVRKLHGNRVNYNLGSAVYREKTREIARQLAQRYGDHPRLLAWHMSNEYNGADYSPESIAQFREWLRRRYHDDLNALNHAYWAAFWSHTFGSWDEIDAPGRPLGEVATQGLIVDWQRFVTDQTIEFMLNEAAPLREISPSVPVTTNLMGTYPGLDYRKFAPHLDFVSWDSYPSPESDVMATETWVNVSFKHDLMRSLKRDRPWLLMESTPSTANWYTNMTLKRPGMHRFEGLHALAHGSDGVQYFQWRQSRGGEEQHHGAVVTAGGASNTRVFAEVRSLGEELETLGDLSGTLTQAQVAIVFDWEAKWALDASSGPVRGDKGYDATVLDHYRAFWEMGVSVDVIGLDDDLSPYRLLVAPMAYSLRPGFAERVKGFLEAGGTFASTYLSGWVSESSLLYLEGLGGPLREILGIEIEELDVLPDGRTNSVEFLDGNPLQLSGSFAVSRFCELAHTKGAEALAVYGTDFYAGRPAVTRHRLGEGTAYYVGARCGFDFVKSFFHRISVDAKVNLPTGLPLPTGVTVQTRLSEKEEFLFVLNASETAKEWTGTPFGDFSLPAWGAEIRRRGREDVKLNSKTASVASFDGS